MRIGNFYDEISRERLEKGMVIRVSRIFDIVKNCDIIGKIIKVKDKDRFIEDAEFGVRISIEKINDVGEGETNNYQNLVVVDETWNVLDKDIVEIMG